MRSVPERGTDSLVAGASPLAGSFSPGGFEGRPRRQAGRSVAVVALVLSVIWVGGFASMFAIPLAILALSSGNVGRGFRVVAIVALVLGIAGLALSGYLAFHFGVSAY
ncbi:MAG: hypothetical protein JJU45_08815 [Acidimicrobiia bacterium]|nr:hypothetical protein [Acidimicrobiia bacterium]